MILLLMWEYNRMCQLSKVLSTDIQKFLSRIRLKSVSSLAWCGAIVFKRGNIVKKDGQAF
jgi:hypothetical protein